MSNSSSVLQISPDILTFRDVSVGEAEAVLLHVLNTGNVPVKIRFTLSNSSQFRLSKDGLITVAPGLEAIEKVKFVAPDLNKYSDIIKIESSVGSMTVPVVAYPPAPRFSVDKPNINLNNVNVNTETNFDFTLTNVGTADAQFSLNFSDPSIRLTPPEGNLPPAETITIRGVFLPKNVDVYDISINIDCIGIMEPIKPIKLTANSINNSLSFLQNNHPIQLIDFNTVFYGQKRKITTTLVNNSQQKKSFIILPPQDISSKSVPSKALSFIPEPSEGTINAFGSLEVTFTFYPRSELQEHPPDDDFESSFTHVSAIEVVETAQRIDFQLSGKAVYHRVYVPIVDFDFGESLVNKRSTKTLTIENKSQFLSTSFEIKEATYFHFSPIQGTIPKGKTITISVTFSPKSFGSYEKFPIINFNKGIEKVSLTCIGQCVQKIDAKPFVREPITSRDSNARFNYNHPDPRYQYTPEQSIKLKEKKKLYDSYISETAKLNKEKNEEKAYINQTKKLAETMFVDSEGQINREEVNKFVQTKLRERESNDDSINLGLESMKSLTPRDPPLRRQKEVFLSTRTNKNKSGFDMNSMSSTQKVKFDENVLIKKKFKSKPTTPTEISDCSHPLTPAQQLMIDVSHQSINFGSMSVNSSFTKSFTVTNNLQQNILISMVYDADELALSSPTAQVIPPNQTAGFDIKFNALKPCNFNKTIEYSINSSHTFPINVTATVSPINLQLSKSTIEFKFTSGSTSPFVKEFVTIFNKSSSKAHFSWESSNPSFSLSTLSGYIDASKSLNVEITYIPGRRNQDETILTLKVDGGPSRMLKCIGTPGCPKCSLMRKKIDFGLVPVGIVKSQILKVKNSGEDDAIFSVTNPNLSELSITPASGRIIAHDSLSFEIQFKTSQAHAFDYNVVIEIAGAQALNFNVSGRSELPKVELSASEFDFGKVFVGSTTSIPAKLTNVGSIPAILYLDLLTKPEFRIEYSSELADSNSNGQNCNSISLVTDHFFITTDLNNENASNNNNERIDDDEISPHPPSLNSAESERSHFQRFKSSSKNGKQNKESISTSSSSSSGLIYKINLIENSSIEFNLVYQPVEVNEHNFEFPITLTNVATSSSYHLQPIVSAEAVQAPISLSSNSVDFGIAPIFNPNNPHARPSVGVLKIENELKTKVSWHFEVQPDETFDFEPKEGTLQNGQLVNVHLRFRPKTTGPFNFYLPLYAKTEKEEECLISKIKLTGVGSPLKFKISHDDIFLPIVPLNVKSQMIVYVINQAFIEATLKVETMFDKKVCPIDVTFPEGNVLTTSAVKLPVLVSFQSATPLSFSTLIAIVDEKGNATSFNVSCTTDNSIFTLYPFINGLTKEKVDIKCQDGGKPILIDVSKFNENFTSEVDISQLISVSDFLELKNKKLDADFPRLMKVADFIVRYFNSKVMNTPISDFPSDFIRNDGSLLQEAITNFSGGKKNSFESGFSNERDQANSLSLSDPVMKKKEAMKKIIRNLQSMGAMLSSVKPEFLLSRSDFISVMRTKIIKKLLGIDYFKAPEINELDQKVLSEFTSSKEYTNALMARIKALESAYEMLSFKSWLMLTMQMVKIFVINKVDGEKLNQVPGVSETIKILKTFDNQSFLINVNRPSKSLSHSNVFSTSECGLLKWISLYMSRESESLISPVVDFADLKDSIGFAAVVKIHTGHPIDCELDKEKAHSEQTAIALRNALNSLKLSFIPKAEDIFNGDRTVLAVISAYLFEMMPHFIPKSTIEFDTSLHKTVTQTFSLSNPSKAEITYSVTIDDNYNFTLPKDSIVVQPSETVEVPIVFHARSIKPLTTRLELVPSRPRMVSNSKTVESQSGRSKQHDSMKSTVSVQSSAVPRVPVFSAPIVLNVNATVSFKSPDQSFEMEGQIYESTSLTIPIKNFLNASSHLTIKSNICQVIDEYGKTVQQPPLQSIVSSLISGEFADDPIDSQPLADDSPMVQLLKMHRCFIVHENEITFTSEEETKDVEIEFIPIGLGTFRLILLFIDEKTGEFIIDVKARSSLPTSVEVADSKLKCQEGQKVTTTFPLDLMNPNLNKAIAYSIERSEMLLSYNNERKFKEQITKRIREVDLSFKQSGINQEKYKVINSAPAYFEMQSDVTLKSGKNEVQISFKPSKPGEYPCHLLFISKYDVRHLLTKGIGIASTRQVDVEFAAVAGRQMKQDIPLRNSSNDEWNYKVTLEGDEAFFAPSKVTVKPSETVFLSIKFKPFKVGGYSAQLVLFNINKESTVVYNLTGNAEEPPAEEKLIFECTARQKQVQKIDVKPFIVDGVAQVTSTVPIISYNPTITISEGLVNNGRQFEFSILAPRSGVSAGTITFTDPQTKSYVWYVLEIHVKPPEPEETIDVKTVARKSSSITIPIHNSKSDPVHFNVTFSDDDIIGEKEFTIPPNGSKDFKVVVAPLLAMKRFSSVYFYSDDDGEFWYSLRIEATDPPESTLAQLTAPIGKSASTFVFLENPLSDKTITFRFENENQSCFMVVSKKSVISLLPKEKKRIEVRYIPSSVGVKDTTTISFISCDTGEFVYHLCGTGKPPQPLSPVIVSCPKDSVNSALILFNNPFPYPGRFSVSMSSECGGEVFNFLLKKKIFTLNSYDEEFQIPFTFSPKEIGQFKAFVIVASLGPSKGPLPDLEFLPTVRWVYPIIGNSVNGEIQEVTSIKCKAMQDVTEEVKFTLVGENEIFNANEYSLTVMMPIGFEFLRNAIEAEAIDVLVEQRSESCLSNESSQSVNKNSPSISLITSLHFTPQRPFNCVAKLKIRNPLSQEWSFDIELNADRGKPLSTIVIESLLNKQGSAKVSVPFAFRTQTQFSASFLPGSASELTVEPKNGIIQPSFVQPTELPITIMFAPKMYGKLLKGVLIVDTQEAQFLFDVVGKTPEYVPPDLSNLSPRIDNQLPEDVQKFHEMQKKKKRNIIRDNIENVKTARRVRFTNNNRNSRFAAPS